MIKDKYKNRISYNLKIKVKHIHTLSPSMAYSLFWRKKVFTTDVYVSVGM